MIDWRDKLIVTLVVALMAWASFTLHSRGPTPGTLDFRDTNYPGER